MELMNGAVDPLLAMLICLLGAVGVLLWSRHSGE